MGDLFCENFSQFFGWLYYGLGAKVQNALCGNQNPGSYLCFLLRYHVAFHLSITSAVCWQWRSSPFGSPSGITKRQYQRDGAKIAEVQRGILATSQNAEPYDVFICYKESDTNGDRTRDSLLAQDIYYQLTEQGRKVFFARITLEDVAGTQYEPYIFAALNSAKVMIVVGTKAEYLNAVWVKNEWSRFLAMMKKDRHKLLLPCYRDMDPYDMPEELSMLQSQDMGKIGFIQDLIRGVNEDVDNADQDRMTEIAKFILNNFNKSTFDGEFDALFAVQSVPMLIRYYKIFKSLMVRS